MQKWQCFKWQNPKTNFNTKGYHLLSLRHNGKLKNVLVHRLVCHAFNGPPTPEKCEVNHINGNKIDNRPENLEWVTPEENRAHAQRLGLHLHKGYGDRHGFSKVTSNDIPVIRRLHAEGMFCKDIGKIYGIHQTTVGHIVRRTTWKHVA